MIYKGRNETRRRVKRDPRDLRLPHRTAETRGRAGQESGGVDAVELTPDPAAGL